MAEKDTGKDVLIVDDEETVGIGMSEILRDAGYNASYVTSGKEALKAIQRKRHNLIFMDMMMPELNGLDTYRKIRTVDKDVRVVLFTGYFKDVDRAIFDGVREGMIDVYIRKPFFADEIIHTAKKYA